MSEFPRASDQDLLDQEHQSLSPDFIGDVSCATFNILAPIYKRLNSKSRESEFRDDWLSRNQSILDRLLQKRLSIICLQEFWVGNEELVSLYEKRLGDAGYVTYRLARTNNRGDGLLTAVHQNHFQVPNYRKLLLNDFADRVAQLLHIELATNFSQYQVINTCREALVVNTHLLFPHNSSFCLSRLQQVYKILQHIELYCDENQLPPVPIILCGDWNGSKRGHVYKFLRSQGFISSYDTAHHYTDDVEDAHRWVSHRNHRGNICGVDFIWLRNPNSHRKPLKESFIEAVLGNIKNCLQKVLTEGTDPLHLLTSDDSHGSYITYSCFSQALSRLGLSTEDITEVWNNVDTYRGGAIEIPEFNIARKLCTSLQLSEEHNEKQGAQRGKLLKAPTFSASIGFDIKAAMLFPPEAGKGMWPENYSLSDHALLTVEFSPARMHC